MLPKLSRQYRYIKEKIGEVIRIRLVPVPLSGQQAFEFYVATIKIANQLFNNGKSGGSLNSVCTAQFGGVLFQSKDYAKNLARAKKVTAIWRSLKKNQSSKADL